ncbi:MAG TPA: hypothetical protein VGR88_05140 [Ktedonobacterales bacterium]|nr:hypothetical protein [Ktedonobacterales bacterium]
MQDNHPNTDQDILNNRTPGTNPDLDVGQRADQSADTNPLTGTQSTEADANNPGQIPVAGYTGDQFGSAGQVGQSSTGGWADQPDARAGEEYNTAPRATDPEQELLDPGYDPRLPGAAEQDAATTPGQPGFADNPGLGGMPNQQGQQDQTTYHSGG